MLRPGHLTRSCKCAARVHAGLFCLRQGRLLCPGRPSLCFPSIFCTCNSWQVRFACDVSIGVDFFLAETRAIETLNFLLASFPALALSLLLWSHLRIVVSAIHLHFNCHSHSFFQALAQQARSQTAATGAKLELESGCLRYFEWGSVAVVTTSPNAAPQRSSAITTQPLLMFLILTSISIAVFN